MICTCSWIVTKYLNIYPVLGQLCDLIHISIPLIGGFLIAQRIHLTRMFALIFNLQLRFQSDLYLTKYLNIFPVLAN